MTNLEQIILYFDSRAQLSRIIGVSSSYVDQLVKRKREHLPSKFNKTVMEWAYKNFPEEYCLSLKELLMNNCERCGKPFDETNERKIRHVKK